MTEPADDDLQQRTDGASNVLLRGPLSGCPADAVCTELLSAPGRTNVLFVALTEPPDDRVAFWREHMNELEPNEIGFVTPEGASFPHALGMETARSVERIAGPENLAGIGMAVSRMLETWQDNGNRSVVCFRSVTTLLQHVELERAFRFFHVLTGRVEAAGAVAHYHLDPTAHDEPTMKTLERLFDVII